MNLAFKTILVATDFSPAADLALEYARTLAKRFQAAIRVVHVVKEPYPIGVEGDVPDISGFRKSILEPAHRQLDTLLAATPGASGVVLVGPPAGRIIENPAECNADLIVMGTHGRGALTGLVLGSVAARVVRTALCPVLTIRDDEPARALTGD